MKALALGDRGALVEDAQQRLRLLGFHGTEKDIDGYFNEEMLDSVRKFRASYDLKPNDLIDRAAWDILMEQRFSLGDRTLYLRMPNFSGEDVCELQRVLNVLGFSCGQVDGFYDANTENAVREFQFDSGLKDDGIVSASTYEAIFRLNHAWKGKNDTAIFPEQAGFTRAAEVIERMRVCFYGIDDASASRIASRIANLASATTGYSMISSADTLYEMPAEDTLLVQLSTKSQQDKNIPTLRFVDDATLIGGLRAAIAEATDMPKRILIEIPELDVDNHELLARGEQRAATHLLDAFCCAFEDAL